MAENYSKNAKTSHWTGLEITHLSFFIFNFEALNWNIENNSLFMMARTFNSRFCKSHRFGTHCVTSSFINISNADQLTFKIYPIPLESKRIIIR